MALPGMPVENYVQEAEDQVEWALVDLDELTAMGMSREMFDSILIRSGALREAQSKWMRESKTLEEDEKAWSEKAPLAFEFRDELLRYFRFAFRAHPDLLDQVAAISEGESREDMIQDLNDLAVLGRNNPVILEKINFDMTKIDKAAAMSDEVATFLASVNRARMEKPEALNIRNRAYTYLKMAHDEVKATARFIFWDKEEKLKGYRSKYRYKENLRLRRNAMA